MRWRIEKQPPYQALEVKLHAEECAMAAADSLAETVREHIRREAGARHGTASRLGAMPTHHLERGARETVATREGRSAVVTVPIPGITRAFGDLHIRTKNAKALTIPINAVSYGMRAPELADRGWSLFTLSSRQGPGAGVLFGRKAGAKSTVALYLLRKSADIPQDRELMPSDEAMGEAIAYGVTMAIEAERFAS